MGRRGRGEVVRQIKAKVAQNRDRYTVHAIQEMLDEDVTKEDVRRVLSEGVLVAKLIHDPRGTRYIFRGPDLEGRGVEAVCRLLGDNVRIVTVYRVE
ncbi:MAG: DUF4258 domain-containing protein [Planctomycetes bacterium]|nr:DUF4258 domain-containing protein [Planctomycetota bacterium]